MDATTLAPSRARPFRQAGLPDISPFAVERDRLITLLDLASHQRVTLVVAPPGYGKTILLAQWAAAQVRRRPCWLALGHEHANPARLARDLCEALGTADGASLEHIARKVDTTDERLGPRFLDELLEELEGLPPTILVLDDFHRLSNQALVDDLGTIIDHGPRSLHVVIATRVDPSLAYYRWRLSDALVELRQEDLAFTREEATPLLRRLSDHELTRAHVESLVERTEGWAVGLHLAALALRERPDPGAFVDTIANIDRHVADYLTEEVLRHQPEAARRFLLATSVLRHMNGALCEFVTGQPCPEAMLEDFERSSLFISRVEAQRGWFRYHELFRTLLHQHMRDEDPDLERHLLRRAGEWHRRRGELDAAVSYLVEAADWDGVLDIATSHGRSAPAPQNASAVAEWIEQVPETAREGSAEIALLEAAGLAIGGEAAHADAVLDRMRKTHQVGREELAVADALRSYSALQRGALDQAVESADLVLRSVGCLDEDRLPNVLGLTGSRADLVALASLTRGVSLLYEGALPEARRCLEAVLVEGGQPLWQVAALGALSVLEAWSGALRAAETAGRRAISLAGQLGLDEDRFTAEAYLGLARVARQRDRLEEAEALLDELESRLRPNRRPDLTASGVVERALVALAKGESQRGLLALATRRASEHHALPSAVRARVDAVEAQLLITTGDLDGAARMLRSLPTLIEVASTRVHLELERGDLGAARLLLRDWPDGPEPRASLEQRLWQGILDHLSEDGPSALAHLATVTATAEGEDDIGIFRSTGHHGLGPVRTLYRSSPTPFLRAVVETPYAVATKPQPKAMAAHLTEREAMVLGLLPLALSTSAMADRLGVSVNTTKTHLKHIYRKLGVESRSAAVEAAEGLRIL